MPEDRPEVPVNIDSSPNSEGGYNRGVMQTALKSSYSVSDALSKGARAYDESFKQGNPYRTGEDWAKIREVSDKINQFAKKMFTEGTLTIADTISSPDSAEAVLLELDEGQVSRIVFGALVGDIEKHKPVREDGQIRRYAARNGGEIIPNLFVEAEDPELENPNSLTKIKSPVKVIVAKS